MILLLVVVTWIVTLSVVAGLCAAARAGDIAQPAPAPVAAGCGRARVSPEHGEILAHAQAPDASLLRSGGIAA